ncbi:hypothetical protein KI387_035741, partial [Taxus chinensis]
EIKLARIAGWLPHFVGLAVAGRPCKWCCHETPLSECVGACCSSLSPVASAFSCRKFVGLRRFTCVNKALAW